MSHFYFTAFLVFAAWKTLSITLHYFSASPWGGPLVLSPSRLLPDTLFIEWGLLAIWFLITGALEILFRSPLVIKGWRVGVLASTSLYCIFGQFDQEVVRWLGQHMTLSYIQNYIGARDGQMAARILSGDVFWTAVAANLMIIALLAALITWRIAGHGRGRAGIRLVATAVLFAIVSTSAHQWFRPSEKRWRRIRPAVVAIAKDATIALLRLESPDDPRRASSDLLALANTGDLAAIPADEEIPNYPLWRDDNVGMLTHDEFIAQPLEERPDVVFIVFETLRAWNTGLVPHPDLSEGSPELNAILREEAMYFPYTHSAGFPSVEGCMGMHLGIWPHFRKIFLSDYGHIRSRAFPEILREFGYETSALLGADPSFSNFTPWIERWYGDWEYRPAVHHDGPLVDRFMEKYTEGRGENPRLMMMWTATTHPPYDLPEEEGIAPADSNEARFVQALDYSNRHIARLIQWLKTQPDWERTVVVIVGDHAQPTPEQWLMADRIGNLTPGHTWTVLGILGGWHGLPDPQRVEMDISHVDLAPTLLSILNIRTHNHFIGRDLTRIQNSGDDRPVVAFRYGDIAWQQDDQRVLFRLDSPTVLSSDVDRHDALEYGALPGSDFALAATSPDAFPVERWRDVIRFYGVLLDENRLMPPPVN